MVISRRKGAEKQHAQLQHNMWVTNARASVLSIITAAAVGRDHHPGGYPLPAPPPDGEKKFWRCVENRDPLAYSAVEPPRPRIEAVRMWT